MKKIFKICVALALFVIIANTASAALIENADEIDKCVENQTCFCEVGKLIGNLAKFITGIIGALALLFFIYGGLMWILSGGEKKRIETGRNSIVYSVIGLVITIGAFALVNLVLIAIVPQEKTDFSTAQIFGKDWTNLDCEVPVDTTSCTKAKAGAGCTAGSDCCSEKCNGNNQCGCKTDADCASGDSCTATPMGDEWNCEAPSSSDGAGG